jgi:hypothetical protein
MTTGQEVLRGSSLVETLDGSGVALGLVLVLGLGLALGLGLGLGVGVGLGSLLRCPCQMLRAV